MAAPEYMKDLRKSSQLGVGVYSWLHLSSRASISSISTCYFWSIWDI